MTPTPAIHLPAMSSWHQCPKQPAAILTSYTHQFCIVFKLNVFSKCFALYSNKVSFLYIKWPIVFIFMHHAHNAITIFTQRFDNNKQKQYENWKLKISTTVYHSLVNWEGCALLAPPILFRHALMSLPCQFWFNCSSQWFLRDELRE